MMKFMKFFPARHLMLWNFWCKKYSFCLEFAARARYVHDIYCEHTSLSCGWLSSLCVRWDWERDASSTLTTSMTIESYTIDLFLPYETRKLAPVERCCFQFPGDGYDTAKWGWFGWWLLLYTSQFQFSILFRIFMSFLRLVSWRFYVFLSEEIYDKS